MRLALLVILVTACGDDGGTTLPPVDAARDAPRLIDAPRDAPVDARPDAPGDAFVIDAPMNVANACANVCAAIAVCLGLTEDPDCRGDCAVDLADCSMAQVTQVDACSNVPCGPGMGEDNGVVMCLEQISCIDG